MHMHTQFRRHGGSCLRILIVGIISFLLDCHIILQRAIAGAIRETVPIVNYLYIISDNTSENTLL